MTWLLALVIGPVLGMKTLAFDPVVFWIACGGLGALAASIISVSLPPRPDRQMLTGPELNRT